FSCCPSGVLVVAVSYETATANKLTRVYSSLSKLPFSSFLPFDGNCSNELVRVILSIFFCERFCCLNPRRAPSTRDIGGFTFCFPVDVDPTLLLFRQDKIVGAFEV